MSNKTIDKIVVNVRKRERDAIVEIIKKERDTWIKPIGFNYRKALTDLIQKIEKTDSDE